MLQYVSETEMINLKNFFAERRVFMGTLELFDITRYVSEKNVEILRGGICL